MRKISRTSFKPFFISLCVLVFSLVFQQVSFAEPKLKCRNVAECQAIFEQTAKAFMGSSYSYGSTGKRGFDCSGLVVTVMGKLLDHVTLPRSSQDMYRSLNQAVTLETAKRGDLLFFNTGRGVSHVGLYWGKDGSGRHVMFHSSSSKGVELRPLNGDKYWMTRLVGVKRFSPFSNALFLSALPGKNTEKSIEKNKNEISSTTETEESDSKETRAELKKTTKNTDESKKDNLNLKTERASKEGNKQLQNTKKDLKNVTFKPMKKDLNEYKSSYIFDNNDYAQPEGQESQKSISCLHHSNFDSTNIAYEDSVTCEQSSDSSYKEQNQVDEDETYDYYDEYYYN